VLSSQSIVSSSRAVRPCNPWGGQWIWHWKTTWSTVWSSSPHSQAAEAAIPHLCKQEQKRLTPVRRRLSRTQAVLGRAIPGRWVEDKNTGSHSVLQLFRIRPERRTSVIVVRWTDKLLCSGYKCVSRFEIPCIPTEMSRLHGTVC